MLTSTLDRGGNVNKYTRHEVMLTSTLDRGGNVNKYTRQRR